MAGSGRRVPIGVALVVGAVAVAVAVGATYLATRPGSTRPSVLGEQLRSPSQTPVPQPTLITPQPTLTPVAPERTPAPVPEQPAPSPAPQPVVQRPNPAPSSCLNSTNPSCGKFFWTPAPGSDEPLAIRVSWAPAPASVGEPVSFSVIVDDGDARIEDAPRYSFGDAGTASDLSCPPSNRYGPWTTPQPQHGHLEFTVSHTYSAPGHYVAHFVAHSGHCGDTPYGASIAIDVPVDVQAPASASPSPSPSPQPSDEPPSR